MTISPPPSPDLADPNVRVVGERQYGHIEALRLIAAELRDGAEEAATTSRDFGRGMSWAARIVETRLAGAEAGCWPVVA